MKYENRDELIEKAKGLKESGLSYQAIARAIGVKKGYTIKCWLDPATHAQKKAQAKTYREKHREELNRKDREYHAAHREESRASSRAHHKAHAEEHRANAKQWHKDNPERVKEINARYRENHQEEIQAKAVIWRTTDEYREYQKQYTKDNGERLRAKSKQHYNDNKAEYSARARIRALKIKEFDKIPQSEYDALFESQNGFCAYCGKELKTDGKWTDPDFYNLDHIYPVSKGGIHTLGNLVYSCHKCNMEKETKTIEEWRPELLETIGNGIKQTENDDFTNLIQRAVILLNEIVETKEAELLAI